MSKTCIRCSRVVTTSLFIGMSFRSNSTPHTPFPTHTCKPKASGQTERNASRVSQTRKAFAPTRAAHNRRPKWRCHPTTTAPLPSVSRLPPHPCPLGRAPPPSDRNDVALGSHLPADFVHSQIPQLDVTVVKASSNAPILGAVRVPKRNCAHSYSVISSSARRRRRRRRHFLDHSHLTSSRAASRLPPARAQPPGRPFAAGPKPGCTHHGYQ